MPPSHRSDTQNAPASLAATTSSTQVALDWADNNRLLVQLVKANRGRAPGNDEVRSARRKNLGADIPGQTDYRERQ